MVRTDLFNSFTPEQQKVIMSAAKEASKYERKLLTDQEKVGIEELQAKGMTITYPNRAKLQNSTAPVYKKFEETIGKDIIQKIINTK
jgi:TRAP-type C4-dicarboxylate transport system substrate-binding protein